MRGAADTITILHVDNTPEFVDPAAARLEQADDRPTVRTATHPDADGDVDGVVLSPLDATDRQRRERDRRRYRRMGETARIYDRDGLRQFSENLLRNAVEHGSTRPGSPAHPDADGHGTTTAETRPRAAAEETVHITVGGLDDPPTGGGFHVKDDGPGIPPDSRDAAFESGHSTAPDGAGFGLDIVAEIAAEHGWSIRVIEADGGGARFEITDVTLVDVEPDS